MHRNIRRTVFTLGLLALPAAVGCGGAEIASLEAANKDLKAEVAAAETESAAAIAAAEKAHTEALAEVESELRRVRTELQQESAAAMTLRGQLETAQDATASQDDAIEKAEKALGRVESHRDELIEWVNELLPLAEAQDPRLANLRDMAAEMAKEVESIRGLEFKRPFMRRLINRDDVMHFMMRDMKREMSEEDAREMVLVMAEFGMMKKDDDIYELFGGFLEAGVAAFYKPDTGTFYLIEGKNDIGDRPIVFHELVHAVEDQHFGLDAMTKHLEENSDGGMGFKALVEGSAEHWTNVYGAEHPDEIAAMAAGQMTPEMMQRQMQMLQEVPAFLIAAMGLYPYKNGAAWVNGIGAATPEGINELFRSPPASTEQVLHPEKHGKDFPQAVEAPKLGNALGAEWEVLDDDGMGELFTGLLLATRRTNPNGGQNMQTFMSIMDMKTQGFGLKGKLAKAAAGWDGDRYTVAIDQAENVCIAWTSVWDSTKDADEFADYYGKLLGGRYENSGKPLKELTLPAQWESEAGFISAIEVAGDRVHVVLSAPPEQLEAVMQSCRDAEITKRDDDE